MKNRLNPSYSYAVNISATDCVAILFLYVSSKLGFIDLPPELYQSLAVLYSVLQSINQLPY